VNKSRRKVLTDLALHELVNALTLHAEAAEQAMDGWTYFTSLERAQGVVGAADNDLGALDDAHGQVEAIQQEEEDALHNLPEALQGAAQGERMSEALGHLADGADSLLEAQSEIRDAVDALDRLAEILSDTLADEDGGCWIFTEAEIEAEVEALYEQIGTGLRAAADAAQAAADAVEQAVCC